MGLSQKTQTKFIKICGCIVIKCWIIKTKQNQRYECFCRHFTSMLMQFSLPFCLTLWHLSKFYTSDNSAMQGVKNPVFCSNNPIKDSNHSHDVCVTASCGTTRASPCQPGPWEVERRWLLTSSLGTPLSLRLPGWRCSDRTGWPSSLSISRETLIFILVLKTDTHIKDKTFLKEPYIVHGIHQFGEVVEPLGAGHYAFLLHVDGSGKFSYVVLSHFFKCSLTFQTFKRHWEDKQQLRSKTSKQIQWIKLTHQAGVKMLRWITCFFIW